MIKREMRGDTIIEVLLSVTLFSLVAVSTMALMNRGVAVAQQSLETTLVRQQIDAQAEMLRFIHDRARSGEAVYGVVWNDILGSMSTDNPEEILDSDTCKVTFAQNGFVLYDNPDGTIARNAATYIPADVYAKVEENGRAQGIDIQMVRTANGKAYDAYIQACWDTPASEKPMTIGTIVRLYDPEA